jgi:DNA-directed RNA polymerase subunit F
MSSESLGKLKSLINDLRNLGNDLSVSAEILASYLMLSRDVYPRPEDPIKELISRKPYISYDDVQNILKIYSKYVV